MTHEDLAVQNILQGLSPEEQSKVRLGALTLGVTLPEYFAMALVAGTKRILDAAAKRQSATTHTELISG